MDEPDSPDVQMDEPDTPTQNPTANVGATAMEPTNDSDTDARKQTVNDDGLLEVATNAPTTIASVIVHKPVEAVITEYAAPDSSSHGTEDSTFAVPYPKTKDSLNVVDNGSSITDKPMPGHEDAARAAREKMGPPSGRQSRMSVFEEESTVGDDDFYDAMQSVSAESRPQSRMSVTMQDVMDDEVPVPDLPKFDNEALDLVHRVQGMYRLLDLVAEESSSGLIEKVIMDAEGMKKLMEKLSPGAYTSMTKVNFRALDTAVLHPVGVYGSKESIVQFLLSGGKVDAETAELLVKDRSSAAVDVPSLRSGLYVVHPDASNADGQVIYVIYWPEDTTWEDDAGPGVKRNRVTFMRFLTKLCDQLLVFISPEHSAKLVWGDDSDAEEDEEMDDGEENNRVFSFQVKKTTEQEDSVEVFPGFTIKDHILQPARMPAGVKGDYTPRLVGGELQQGVMTASFVEGRVEKRVILSQYYPTRLASELRNVNCLKLGKDISAEGITILVNNGLRTAAPEVCKQWEKQLRDIEETKKKETGDAEKNSRERSDMAQQQVARIFNLEAIEIVKARYRDHHVSAVVETILRSRISPSGPASGIADPVVPSRAHEGTHEETSEAEHGPPGNDHHVRPVHPAESDEDAIAKIIDDWKQLLTKYPDLQRRLNEFCETSWTKLLMSDANYANLKARFVAGLEYATMAESIYDDDDAELATHIMSGRSAKLPERYQRPKGFLNQAMSLGKGLLGIGSEVAVDPKTMPDPAFLDFVMKNSKGRSWLEPVVNLVVQTCADVWIRNIGQQTQRTSHEAAFYIERARKEVAKGDIERAADTRVEKARRTFLEDIQAHLLDQPGRSLTLERVGRVKSAWNSYSDQYDVKGYLLIPHSPSIKYEIHFLSIPPHDQTAIRSDPSVLPTPQMPKSNTIAFRMPLSTTIRHVQLIDTDKVLLICETAFELSIFVEKRSSLPNAVENYKPRRPLKREKLAANTLISYDEGSRLVAILSADAARCLIHIYVIDDKDCSVRQRGSPVDITRWLGDCPDGVTNMCFATGSSQEELCIVEQSGRARMFSLVTETCRPAFVQLPATPSQLFSAPDGSCLVVLYPNRAAVAYHCDRFGSSEGIVLSLPENWIASAPILTSFVTRSCIHLLDLDLADRACKSVRLRIQKRSSEFHLRKDQHNDATHAVAETAHNCLVECLSDVWTRFPVVPAIGQDTLSVGQAPARITYICEDHHDRFQGHFGSLVRRFERTTRKPTQRLLEKISVDAMSFENLLAAGISWRLSSIRAGDWIIKSICLLPLQIAVARDNRFLPLKNGVWSSALEQHMLGSSVKQVADNITFGWYESIFTHYDKPVKVVSSMGEQSTGKSYMLAHLVDTSFAGSAMRCTEGVWMCVTPTTSTLFVALDFEGVHSLERSVQEDALLVLFNAAISNLILFRNNFAMSRNIAGMFTSFQSSSSLFDPAANPSLFQSCLVIIIKDVVDADTQGIVQEFEDKFQRIVTDEQDANFLTRLHRGQLRIIPWPVIESRKYYTAYSRLRTELVNQPVSHPRAGAFLHTMKTLMAKIKACDWGALDQNLAVHRADQLRSSLHNALVYGLDESMEPLTDLDTNTSIPHGDSSTVFYLCGPVFNILDDPAQREAALATICAAVGSIPERQDIADEDWMANLTTRVENLLDARISHVKDWVAVNATRFEGHADIQQLVRIMDAGTLELRESVSVCRSECAECYLLCTLSKRHAGPHNCQAGHSCKHDCSFVDEHDDGRVHCGLPGGHSGKHMCEVGLHLCGQRCALHGKPGCLSSCMKHADHADEGHLCSARTHGCGQLCSLSSTGLCGERCAIAHDEPHSTHTCKAKGCAHTCQLCKRLCSSPDHFHGQHETVTHLCGQEHACNRICTSEGYCEVSTDPIAVESTFTGRHDTFQFTKYSQSFKKLVCAVPIPAGQTEHRGGHVHDIQSAKPFHYCTEICPSCGYVCNLPFGHPQREHETAHGSMSQTEWVIEGDGDASVEVGGHVFGQRDVGAPMLCSVYCSSLGRHAHIDICKTAQNAICGGRDYEHIHERMHPNPQQPKDFITHKLFWQRSGFKDPYSREDQTAFASCDAMCAAPEHAANDANAAQPSYCTLPLFHAPHAPTPAPATGYVSNDGHVFPCANPAVTNQTYHIVFVIDRSTSMGYTDILPLAGTPVTNLIARHTNNRLGAVYSAVYTMWAARHGAGAALRRDAYSVILFSNTATTIVENDLASDPGTLLGRLLGHAPVWGTDFDNALRETQRVMEAQWNNDRAPVVIFLSDGECDLTDALVTDMCRRAVVLGKPLAFHAVSFGRAEWSDTLDLMAHLAREVYRTAPGGGANADTQCTSTRALDTVRLAETFIGIADSLKKPRAALVRSGR
ncbi:hypothetical protein EXIGLDRAFT_4132 [Exidia glandulosa HHB12029]|uniref:VWFA domain-containing protein n=1 Tax=Exidia glandulosa HHB12029 TaxID=1314781 RepID=A0A165QM90_EXIGL|nr:hypothetical protein EXIGLDRAFT_4132 [Exidia glandulosa HHB12029]